jgi:hypothetical protein
VLPLPQDVGDAMLNYVEHWRPDVRDEHVFLRVNAPFVPLAGSSAVSSLVNRAARRAHLSASRIGAHILRHTAASLMLRKGVSLQTIGGLLRHQSIDTTGPVRQGRCGDVIGDCSTVAGGGDTMLRQAIDSYLQLRRTAGLPTPIYRGAAQGICVFRGRKRRGPYQNRHRHRMGRPSDITETTSPAPE